MTFLSPRPSRHDTFYRDFKAPSTICARSLNGIEERMVATGRQTLIQQFKILVENVPPSIFEERHQVFDASVSVIPAILYQPQTGPNSTIIVVSRLAMHAVQFRTNQLKKIEYPPGSTSDRSCPSGAKEFASRTRCYQKCT